MKNYILEGTLIINNNITIIGTIFLVKSEKGLEKIDKIEDFENISGTYDDLDVENLIIKDYIPTNQLIVNGNTTTTNYTILE
jgi:hypothetical protein